MEKYNILEQLGDGTYGIVYRAVNTITNEVVAIKKMKKKYSNWEECINLQEIKALINLKHSNIVILKELIFSEDELNLIFEYSGINLYDHMMNNSKGLTELQIRNIIYQVLQGLSYMQRHDFFHRDIKPENILIRNDCVKIADFGYILKIYFFIISLAKETRNRPPFTEYVATRWYRAPEVILKCKIYGPAIDIFAIGAIMAELYNNKPLFPGKSEFDQMNKICEVLGTPSQNDWAEGYSLASRINFKFNNYKGHKLRSIIPKANDKAINLIESMLNFNPLKRPSASQCLQHAFFQCHDVLSLYGLQLNHSLQYSSITHQQSDISHTPSKNQNAMELIKKKNTYNYNLSNFINIKKNTLPKIDLVTGRTASNAIISSNQNNPGKLSNNQDTTNDKNVFDSNSNPNSFNVNKSHKAKIEDFMSNYFKN